MVQINYFYIKFETMHEIAKYRELFLNYMQAETQGRAPENLYKPVSYILNLGGKRMRPVLTLMVCDLFDGNIEEALPAALAVEVFHNFTLIHDDIMDSAPVRRGQTTVHEKWDINTGILSGDVMMIQSFQYLENYEYGLYKPLIRLFSKTAIEVCEGQQLDMDFQTRMNVALDEYLTMIRNKTSVLVAAAMKMGAMIAGTSEVNAKKIYNFGLHLGLAFQLQDDYLDTFGDAKTFGKKIGGDIAENKKTYLYLKAMELFSDEDKGKLQRIYNAEFPDSDKVEMVTNMFIEYGVGGAAKRAIENYTNKAFAVLDELELEASKKEVLRNFGFTLMKRTM